jgi:amino acid transporter
MQTPTAVGRYDATEAPAATSRSLKPNALGVLGVLFFVIAAQAPLTGMAGAVPVAVGIGNGPGVPAAYLAAGVLVLIFSVGYVAISRHVVNAGAFYMYIRAGLGRALGSGSGLVALFAYVGIQGAMYGLYGAVTSGLLDQHLGINLSWWLVGLITMAIVLALGAAGVDISVRVLAVIVLAEVSILLVFGIVNLLQGGGPEGLGFPQSFSLSAALEGAPGIALMFAIASMFGFEASAIYGEEAREPRRTIPRATYLAVCLISGFFAFTAWMLISAHGASRSQAAAGEALASGDSTSFVFSVVGDLLGAWTGDALAIMLAVSLFAGLLAFHNSANRYLFSLGRDGLLPGALTSVNRRRAPWVAGVVQTVLAALLVVPFAVSDKDPVLTLFSWFSGVAVLAMMLLYLLTSISVIVFFRQHQVDRRPWHTVVAPGLGAAGLAGAIWLILSNFTTLIGGDRSTATWLALTVPAVLVAGAALAWGRRDRAAAAAPSPEPEPAPAPPAGG